MSTKKSILESHIGLQKHERGKLAPKNQHKLNIVEVQKKIDNEHRPVGETLPDSTRVYRVKVFIAMLKAGVPLTKIDSFRELLEDHGLV